MNTLEHRTRNRRLGLILSLLFAGLFIISAAAIITNIKPHPLVGKTVTRIGTLFLGIVGLLLILGAVVEILPQIVKKKIRPFRK